MAAASFNLKTCRCKGEPDINSRTLITKLQILCKGDHVAWPRLGGIYWHHCIVSDVNPKKKKLEVIHFKFHPLLLEKVRIRKSWKNFDCKKKNLYRIDYDPGICYPPEVVLMRAMSQLGNTGYNLLTENCEHFARWCKTGDNTSTQVESFKQLLKLQHSHPNPHHDCRNLSSTVNYVSVPGSYPSHHSAASVGNQSFHLSYIQTYRTKFDTSSNTAIGYFHH